MARPFINGGQTSEIWCRLEAHALLVSINGVFGGTAVYNKLRGSLCGMSAGSKYGLRNIFIFLYIQNNTLLMK